VEVGAADGVTFSNTHHFEHVLGWRGILVEANPMEAEKCRAARPGSTVVCAATVDRQTAGKRVSFEVVEGYELLSSLQITPWARFILDGVKESTERQIEIRRIEVETATLDAILSEAGARPEFDFLTIDIEGHEWAALRGFSLGSKWRPQVFIIENDNGFPPLRIVAYLFRSGYGYHRSIGPNDWYERYTLGRRLTGLFPPVPDTCTLRCTSYRQARAPPPGSAPASSQNGAGAAPRPSVCATMKCLWHVPDLAFVARQRSCWPLRPFDPRSTVERRF
jgi:FkbM family methyltransferase